MKLSKFDAVGVNVKVFLEAEGEWAGGIIEEYHPRKGYHIQIFDGQDIWLESLDENVQFENDYDTAEIELMGGTSNTFRTNMNMTADELEILPVDENQMNVPNYSSHTQYNQECLRADLVTLPSRGVLLTGSVLGAAGLVVGDDSLDGEVFFKVLFVEGGSQPAMFRCKTPIYTSTAIVSSLANPSWNDARFQFDMIMPVDPTDSSSVYGFKIQGEIIVAVYMSRTNGGNALLGQTSFQLKEIIETGTVEFFATGYEGRSVTGGHTLTSRTGDISGELDVQLNIAWKSLNPVNSLATSQAKFAKGHLSASGSVARPASAGATRSKAGIATGTKTGTAPTRRPASAVNSNGFPPPRKIVSNIQRKQKEDAARIARENLKLQQTLMAHANRSGRPSAAATAIPSTVYGVPSGAASAAQTAAQPKPYGAPRDAYNVADSKNRFRDEAKAAKASGTSVKPASEGQSIETLLKLYMDLKRAVALDEQEDVRLKLKIGKLRVSIKESEMAADRLRSQHQNAGNTDSQSKGVSGGGSRNKFRSSGEGALRAGSGVDQYGADAKDFMRNRANRSTSSSTAATVPPIVKQGAHEYVPFFSPMTEAEQQAQGLNDGEYKSLAEEYNVLQTVRRGMLDRIRTAQLACDAAKEKQSCTGERMVMIRRRVGYYRDIVNKLAAGLDIDFGASAEAKNAPLNAPVEEHDDFVLFDRLRDAKQEYVTESAIYESGMHVTAQENALEELRAVRELLTTKCAEKEAVIRTMKEENTAFHQELRRALNRDRQPSAVREQLYKERSSRGLDARAEERLQVVDASIAKVDQELRRFQVRQQSRKNSGKELGVVAEAASDVIPEVRKEVLEHEQDVRGKGRAVEQVVRTRANPDVAEEKEEPKYAVVEVSPHAALVELVDDDDNFDLSPDNSLYDL